VCVRAEGAASAVEVPRGRSGGGRVDRGLPPAEAEAAGFTAAADGGAASPAPKRRRPGFRRQLEDAAGAVDGGPRVTAGALQFAGVAREEAPEIW